MNVKRALATVFLSAGPLLFSSGAWAADKAAPSVEGKYSGITVPSARLQLSLKMGDVVWEVAVKPGDKVKAGDVLITEDTREEEKRHEIIKLEADSGVAVKAAQAALDVAKVTVEAANVTKLSKEEEYKRYLAMGTAANKSELEKARLDFELSKIDIIKSEKDVIRGEREVDKAQVDVDQKKKQAEMQAIVIDRMRIKAPVNGIVEEILVRKGEVVDPQKPAMILVNNEKVWAEVYVPSQVALGLRPGQQMQVTYTGLKDQPKVAGTVIYLSPVVDATADKRLVRVEIDNKTDERPAGLAVEIAIPDGAVAADK